MDLNAQGKLLFYDAWIPFVLILVLHISYCVYILLLYISNKSLTILNCTNWMSVINTCFNKTVWIHKYIYISNCNI